MGIAKISGCGPNSVHEMMTRRQASLSRASSVLAAHWSRSLLICILLLALIGTFVLAGRVKEMEDLLFRRLSAFQWGLGPEWGPCWAGWVCSVSQQVVGYQAMGSLTPFLNRDLTLQRIQISQELSLPPTREIRWKSSKHEALCCFHIWHRAR